MSSPKKTKKAFKCRGVGKLEYLSFTYIEKIASDWEKQHRNGSGSHCVMVQWIHPPGLAFSQPVTLRCREPWTFCPHTMACCVSPLFTPDAGLPQGPLPPQLVSHRDPSLSSTAGCPGGEAEPPALSSSPATWPAWPLQRARRTPELKPRRGMWW